MPDKYRNHTTTGALNYARRAQIDGARCENHTWTRPQVHPWLSLAVWLRQIPTDSVLEYQRDGRVLRRVVFQTGHNKESKMDQNTYMSMALQGLGDKVVAAVERAADRILQQARADSESLRGSLSGSLADLQATVRRLEERQNSGADTETALLTLLEKSQNGEKPSMAEILGLLRRG